jgi:hypothetical protein
MNDRSTHRRLSGASLLLASLCALALQGCGADGFARDTLIENKGAEAFLDRVQQACAKLSVGNQQIAQLMEPGSNDVGFVDAASKYYLGQFTTKQFHDYIEAFYPTGTNGPALACIDAQMAKSANPGN